ncbi:hypothetical protein BKA81DRAFT_177433 [Phyllosticta paracitricarpa]|uniref:Uncharacterized protein n=1 Tax=Phyllosticta paracitricarpa TaxID=2016321 RepID=A0ABR1MXK0_9PEZI
MATETTVHVSIIIFRGEPLDWQKYRHTALLFTFADETQSVMIHATGSRYAFRLETMSNRDPRLSRSFAKEVDVGQIRFPMTKPRLVELISETPINNSDPEFNCQVWVENALQRLKGANQLSEDEYTKGVDGMIDATMEAEHESER